jgi:NAD(P)-dependent dehydrogenase (short-subunit alcohol dehydrogenase family)
LQEIKKDINMELKDKTIIVTGVSKGIGKATVLQLLEKGAKVAGFSKNKPDYEHENFKFIPVNIRSLQEVENAVKETQNHFGEEIHGLVNNAGLGYFGYLEDMEPEQFYEIFEVNVYGIFYACKNVIPQMKKQQFGHIINISSIAGLDGQQQVSAYCGAKHAVRGITESLYKELRDFGVKVTGVYPGSTNTNFFDNAAGINAHDNMMAPQEVATQIIRALETSDNFLINAIEFRPLQPKPKKN